MPRHHCAVVPRAGIEPARPLGRQILSLLCLPISPSGLWLRNLRRRTIYSRLSDRKTCHNREPEPNSTAPHRTAQMRKPLNLSIQGLSDMAQRTGLEPATPGVTGRYSNRLNYRCLSVGLCPNLRTDQKHRNSRGAQFTQTARASQHRHA